MKHTESLGTRQLCQALSVKHTESLGTRQPRLSPQRAWGRGSCARLFETHRDWGRGSCARLFETHREPGDEAAVPGSQCENVESLGTRQLCQALSVKHTESLGTRQLCQALQCETHREPGDEAAVPGSQCWGRGYPPP